MPPFKFHSRFLLRGSALLTALLLLWWFVLLNPLLYLLKESVGFCGGFLFGSSRLITETPSGDWTVEIPMDLTFPGSNGRPMHGHAIDFDVARADAAIFTFGLPLYWAVILAVPGIRRSVQPMVRGTVLVGSVEIALFLAFLQITAHKTATQLTHPGDPAPGWFLRFSEYLVVNTIPYLAPFLSAIWLHHGLREQVFNWASPAPVPQRPAVSGARARRSRRALKRRAESR